MFEEKNFKQSAEKEASDLKEEEKRKEWEEFRDKMKDLDEQVYQKIKALQGFQAVSEWIDAKTAFSRQLLKKYPKDDEKNIAFCALGNATMGMKYENAPGLDFSGEDSVELFYRNKLKELEEIERNNNRS